MAGLSDLDICMCNTTGESWWAQPRMGCPVSDSVRFGGVEATMPWLGIDVDERQDGCCQGV